MKHRARFGPSLVNNFVLYAAVMLVLLPIAVIALVVLMERSLNGHEWRAVVGVFSGAVVLVAILSAVSELADWFEVTADGLTCRTSSGVGAANLIVKNTHQLAWDDITEVRPSKRMPYPQVTLVANTQWRGRTVLMHIRLPLYVRRPSDLARDILTHAPDGNPLRQHVQI